MKKRMTKVLLAVALIACLLCSLLTTASAAKDTVVAAKDGVVEVIMAYELDDGNLLELSYGSGFLINDNAVMTCYHCVYPDSDTISVIEERTGKEFKNDKIEYRIVVSGDVTRRATVWTDAYSKDNDWAVLKLDNTISDRVPLPLGDSSNAVGETIYALGFPAASEGDVPKFTKDDVTVTTGMVSKLVAIDGVQMLEHDAQVSSGSSGGPLINENGEVLGVIVGYIDIYYASQINEIKSVLDALNIEYIDGGDSIDLDPTPSSESTEATEPILPDPGDIFEEEVDTSELDALIEEASALNPDDYTPDSYAKVTDALVAAELMAFSNDQEDIDDAAEALEAAIDGLEEEGGNMILIIAIAGGAVIVIVIIVIIIISSGKKKKKAPAVRPPMPAYPTGAPAVPSAPARPAPVAPFAPGAPARPAYAPPASEEIGATSVLGGDSGAGETTVLGGGVAATLIRNKSGEAVRISRNEFVLGKERSKVDYCISDNNSISRRHAKIMARGGRYYLVDLGSTNCTYVNGAKSAAGMETEIFSGDKIKLSDEEFTFRS